MFKYSKKIITIILFISLSGILFAKTVKVGYFIDSGIIMSGFSEDDPKSGYAYDYLQTIASYTGWDYEYTYGHFEELYQTLINGDIDILLDITYTPERSEKILFSEYPMATESYYLYSKDNLSASLEDLSVLNGKSIAIEENSYQAMIFSKWLQDNNLNLNIINVPYQSSLENDFIAGKYDLYLSIGLVSRFGSNPVAKIGSSEVYVAVNKNRSDLLEELNRAQTDIQESDPSYTNRLWEKYCSQNYMTTYLNSREQKWFSQHPVITIGCPRNEKVYLYEDLKTGELKGLIPFIMERFKVLFELPEQQFEYRFYDSASELDAALDSGEIDAIFPDFYDLQHSEKRNHILSKSFVKDSLTVVYSDRDLFNNITTRKNKILTVAVARDCRVGEIVIESEFFNNSLYEYFDTHEQCLEAVYSKNADITIFTSNNTNALLKLKRKYKRLYSENFYDNVDMCFSASRNSTEFISSMNKLATLVPSADIDRFILSEKLSAEKISLRKFLRYYHPVIILIFLFVILLMVLLFLALSHVQMLINYDVLTRLLNRRTLSGYMKAAINRAKNQGEPFSILIFDLDDFKLVNDNYGHAFGDEVLKMAAEIISKGIKRNDYAFRWGGEEFLVLLRCEKEVAVKVAERIRLDIQYQQLSFGSKKVNITATVGVASYKDNLTEKDLFIIADKNLYTGKNNGKNQVVAD